MTSKVEMKNITKEQFLAYENVRKSGKTNMYDIRNIQALADVWIDREIIVAISENYTELKQKYLEDEAK